MTICSSASCLLQGGKVMGDVVGVLADSAGGPAAGADSDANARRRMSLMSDVTGAETPQTGSERERKSKAVCFCL